MEQHYNHDLKVAYEMPYNGEVIKFYELKHGDQEMLQGRYFMASVFEKFMQLGFTPNMLEAYLNEATKALHSDKPSAERLQDASTIIELMKSYKDCIINEEILLNIATVYYVMEHEPLATYSYEWAETKRNLWATNPEAKVFFCKEGLKNIPAFQNMPWEDAEILIHKSKMLNRIFTNTLTN